MGAINDSPDDVDFADRMPAEQRVYREVIHMLAEALAKNPTQPRLLSSPAPTGTSIPPLTTSDNGKDVSHEG